MNFIRTVVMCTFAASPALADVDLYNFTGTVLDIGGNQRNVAGPLRFGDAFSGTLTYESDGGSPQLGRITVDFPAGGFVYEGPSIFTKLFDDSFGFDVLRLAADGSFGDFNFTNFGLTLQDSSNTVFGPSPELPAVLSFDDFDLRGFQVNGNQLSTGNQFFIAGSLSTLTLVPEPASFVLLGIGGVFMLKRR